MIIIFSGKSWKVNVKKRGVAINSNICGHYLLGMLKGQLDFVSEEKVVFSVPLPTIRKIGYTENRLFFELDDMLGSSELWLEVDNSKCAEDIHKSLSR